jgi:4-amino-4-deoxy-L-arabinose transferase-like glycosyltransferase
MTDAAPTESPTPEPPSATTPNAPAALAFESDRWFLGKLWAAAFLVRLVGVTLGLLFFPGWLVPPDTYGVYYPIARSLAAGTGYQLHGSPWNATRAPPVLPCWLALLMALAGPDLPLWLPALGNAAFRAAAVVLVYLLGRRCVGPRTALLGALLYLLDPWETFWAGFVMKEPLAVPLFLLAVWLLGRFDERRSAGTACAAGAAIGLATLARFPSGALWFVPVILLMLPGRRPGVGRWAAVWRGAGLCACLSAALLAVLSPWLVRNSVMARQPMLSSCFVGQYFYTSNGAGIEMERDGYYSPRGIDYHLLQEAGTNKTFWEGESYLFASGLRHVLDHPAEAMQRVGTKLVNMWQPTFAGSSLRNQLILGVPYCVGMLLCLTGIVLALTRRLPCAALLVPLLVFFCVHLVFWGEIRNRQYLTPLLFPFGGLALESLVLRLRGARGEGPGATNQGLPRP